MTTLLLKLGGSVVTEKDEPETVDEDALAAAAETIGSVEFDRLVVVHGGGSFGHHHASEHGISRTAGSPDSQAVRDIQGAMRELNDAVVDALADEGVPAVPVHPFSAAYRTDEGRLVHATTQLAAMLDQGWVPVLHGDVVTHDGVGATILSGDEIIVALAGNLGASRIGLCSTVPGVLDGEGEVIPSVEAYADVVDVLGGSESTDVTGGMAAKVKTLLDLDSESYIFGPDDLEAFMTGEPAGTRISE